MLDMKKTKFFLVLLILISYLMLTPVGSIGLAEVISLDQFFYYLPLVHHPSNPCGSESIINGGFESDHVGWNTFVLYGSYDLIGPQSSGFSPLQGYYAARLGGREHGYDYIEQTVNIPPQGMLSFWWKMRTYDNLPRDFFCVSLLNLDGSDYKQLICHSTNGQQDTWFKDAFDLSAYARNRLILRIDSYNDNYYSSVFDLDEFHLCSQ